MEGTVENRLDRNPVDFLSVLQNQDVRPYTSKMRHRSTIISLAKVVRFETLSGNNNVLAW